LEDFPFFSLDASMFASANLMAILMACMASTAPHFEAIRLMASRSSWVHRQEVVFTISIDISWVRGIVKVSRMSSEVNKFHRRIECQAQWKYQNSKQSDQTLGLLIREQSPLIGPRTYHAEANVRRSTKTSKILRKAWLPAVTATALLDR
jgi:hypothetical protein